ncbi:helix-turn-helix domain-containing protein [Dorea acetigenes]|uniref:Helix-turn-helix domain-containing protein n=1 Tax=Dorea acetigenes TaxID=2981787 RepID=A0ABT2RK47_9FIRM|nr:helix-turn-helix transcriptional regulator [Dorea acetigenes]MCB6415852.1 helix-turn-helix domain-containing protein [Faecalimonas umbilicata]MCU6685740.1 helix-turn-helix domain-containing protein [Dorea acetigenes]
MELAMNFKSMGQKIKRARERKGYTQEELAERVNLSVQHISVIERGIKAPRLETFLNIANELDVDADYLLADLLNVSEQLTSNELYDMMAEVSKKEKRRILEVVKVLIEMADK